MLNLTPMSEQALLRAAGRLNLLFGQLARARRMTETQMPIRELTDQTFNIVFEITELFPDASEVDRLGDIFKNLYNRQAGA